MSWNRTCSRESPEEHYAPRDRHGDTRGRQRRNTRAHQSLLRAVKLDTRLYHEVGADTTATTQAISVVVLVALASGISFAITEVTRGGGAGTIVGALVLGALGALIIWAVQSAFVFLVGTRLLRGTATYSAVLRTLGFAQSPGALYLFTCIPLLGGIIALVAFVWTLFVILGLTAVGPIGQ